MSSNSRFKWIRALPAITNGQAPDYFSYTLKNMRQIPTQTGIAIAGAGAQPIISAFVPAGSWAQTKNLLIRGFYVMTLPAPGAPPTLNILETMNSIQTGPVSLPAPGAFAVTAGIYSTWIQRNLVRVATDIWMCDLGDVMVHSFANNLQNLVHVIQVPPLIPPYDFTVPFTVTVEMNITGPYPGAQIQCIWAEAFLEQGTNLGRLP